MDVLHATWFWLAVIAAPVATVVGILSRLSRREPPIPLPPGVQPLAWDDDGEAAERKLQDGDRDPPKH
ncbi:hypothetical protein [Chromobacterium paludis]|uniref:Uncharacterized protein n=1 Tax=Chromobacterium paludis TaxID=2605945 RepID=A0A5C1DD66_9NEIS|nr:hypothetical protein [Chromobacterium paludis]QEL54681.1 hypothetical protein FYK34_03435 [Chromobacterium paludis]